MTTAYNTNGNESFSWKENRCEATFRNSGPYWHLTNNGNEIGLIFACDEDYKYGMNAVAMVAAEFSDVSIITFELMSDHIHLIVAGKRETAIRFFETLRRKLSNYFSRRNRAIDWTRFKCSNPIAITDLGMLRNEIAYVNRNGFVAIAAETPYSYRWGSGHIYFNYLKDVNYGALLKDITYRERREILKVSDISLPENWRVYKGTILPECYCAITFGEALFRDGNHYFNAISKSFEAYSEIAKRLSDKVFLTDSEMYPAIISEIRKEYSKAKPELLSPAEKMQTAKLMHTKYNATNEQIRRILNLDRAIVSELFPLQVKGR